MRRLNGLFSFAAIGAAVLASIPVSARASIVWDNGTFTGIATTGRAIGAISHSPSSPGTVFTPRWVYADFTLAQPATIQGFSTVGYAAVTGNLQNLTDIKLRFYGANGSAPDFGNLLGTTTTLNLTSTPTGVSYPQITTPVFQPALPLHELNLSVQDFLLPAGDYWVEIEIAVSNGFQMQAGNFPGTIHGQETWVKTGAAGVPGPRPGTPDFDVNFKLTGEFVPEPATLVMLLPMGAMVLRRRR